MSEEKDKKDPWPWDDNWTPKLEKLIYRLIARKDTPTSAYAGRESYTFDGGLIIKMGIVTSLTAQEHRSVTFGTAFPNSCIATIACLSETPTSVDDSISVHTVSASKIEIESRQAAAAAYWVAIGH